MPFYVNMYGSFKLSKNSLFFGPPCMYIFNQNQHFVILHSTCPQMSCKLERDKVMISPALLWSSVVSSRFLKYILTCYPVSILICLKLNLSTVHKLSLPSYHATSLKRVALPDIFPSIMSWSKSTCLRTCPSHLCLLHQTVFNMLLVSLTCTNTSSFVTLSVKLIFTILHHVHISNASNSFLLALVNVQVSAAYSATFQTVLFIIHFICSQFNFAVNNFSCPWTMSYPLQFLLVCP